MACDHRFVALRRAGVQTALPLLLSAASLGADTRNPVAEADQLLHDARQAMSEGNLEIADSKITAAEKLAPKYFPLHVGDTPKRARADLDKLLTQRAVGSDKNAKQALAKSASAAGNTADPFQSRSSPATAGGASTDGGLANGLNSTPNATAAPSGAQGPAATDPATLAQGALPASFGMNPSATNAGNNPQGNSSANGISRLRNPSAGSGLANSATTPAGLQMPAGVARATTDQDEPNPWDTDVSRSVYASAADQSRGANRSDNLQDRNQISAKAQSDRLLLEARRALAKDDVRSAQIRCEQAKGLAIRYSPMDDSPEKIEALIRKANNLPTNPAAANSESLRRQRAEVWMEEAEGLSRWHEYDEAERLVGEVQKLGIEYSPFEAKPEQLLSRIDSAKRTAGLPITDRRAVAAAVNATADAIAGRSAVDSAVKQRAVDIAKQGAITWRVAIGRLLSKSRRQGEMLAPDTAFAPGEDRPALVLLDIQRSKHGADTGAVRPAANFQADNNRYPGVTALYNPSNDSTRNIPATEASPMRSLSTLGPATPNLLLPAPGLGAMPSGGNYPRPDSGTGEALRCYRAGLDAVAKGRSDDALRNFRRAYAFQAELDTITRKQLLDHLKILGDSVDPSLGVESSPAEATAAALIPAEARSGLVMTAATGPLPEPTGGVTQTSLAPTSIASAAKLPLPTPEPLGNDPPNKLNATGATGQALARQVAAEVAKQQGLARDLKEKQPKQALETLQHTRDMVASVAGLEPQARDQLVRRLDLSINELKQYIAQNASQINLEESNRKIQQSVDRSRQQRVEMQEKLAYLVNDFNKLMDEQRFSDAQVLAKRATELDPDNPLVTQLNRDGPHDSADGAESLDSGREREWFYRRNAGGRQGSRFHSPTTLHFPTGPTWERFQHSKYRQQRDDQTAPLTEGNGNRAAAEHAGFGEIQQ